MYMENIATWPSTYFVATMFGPIIGSINRVNRAIRFTRINSKQSVHGFVASRQDVAAPHGCEAPHIAGKA